jgi:PRTRC genetic system protein A
MDFRTPIEPKPEFLKKFEAQEWAVHLGEIPETLVRNSTLSIFGDGKYLTRSNPIGTFTRRIERMDIPTLDHGPDPSFSLKLPKVPAAILMKQVSFYREVMKLFNDAEAYSIVMYDTVEEQYFLVIPEQTISKAHVKYDQPELRKKYPSDRYIEVISAHSHNSMNAYFSPLDDKDEKGDILYMVMGKLNQEVPTYCIRANVAGAECVKLPLEDLFDLSEENWAELSPYWEDLHDSTWVEQLHVRGPVVSAHSQFDQMLKTFQGSRPRRPFTGRTTGSQMDFFNQTESEVGSEGSEQKEFITIACALIKDARSLPPEQVMFNLISNLLERGYAEDIHAAIVACDHVEEFQAMEKDDWELDMKLRMELDDGWYS